MIMTSKRIIREQRALLRQLAAELFQIETSTLRHCRLEARRLGEIPPAWALSGVADHAERVLRDLAALAARHGMPIGRVGRVTRRLVTTLRGVIVAQLVDGERAYRATLLEIRRGLDTVRMIHHLADRLNDDTLADWCEHWIERRAGLARRVEDELGWFASHPRSELQPARPPLLVHHGQRSA
jgi:hypothetical protein